MKIQEILCNRIAMILDELTLLNLPWICQTTATAGKQASFLQLDKVQQLLKHQTVKHTRGSSARLGPSPPAP